MKFSAPIIFASVAAALPTGLLDKRAAVQGFDISHYQSSVDFNAAYAGGMRFVILKATEGTSYADPTFNSRYPAAYNAGLIHGAYHFASGGDPVAEAKYFLAHGGKWSGDGMTLPGMLDLEADCKSVSWIKSFSDYYQSQTGRYPMIYTSPSWWSSCTGNSNAFVNTNPLVLARYNSSPGTPPGGWPYYSFWQKDDHNTYGGDSDEWNGSFDNLKKFATG